MEKSTDINVHIEGINFMCRSCAVVTHEDRILFQKRKNDRYWALPGGKIGVMETTRDAIVRELNEELAVRDLNVGDVIAVTENFFEMNGSKVHQYIFTHRVTLNDAKYDNIEGVFDGAEKGKDIIFTWIKKSELHNAPIKPDYVAKQLLCADQGVQFTTCTECNRSTVAVF